LPLRHEDTKMNISLKFHYVSWWQLFLRRRRIRVSILAIIFVHYVARSFCDPIKLPKEMPKIAKCLKLRYAVDLNRKGRAKRHHKSSIFNLQFRLVRVRHYPG